MTVLRFVDQAGNLIFTAEAHPGTPPPVGAVVYAGDGRKWLVVEHRWSCIHVELTGTTTLLLAVVVRER